MKIRKITNNILDRFKGITEEETINEFENNKYTYKVNIVKNKNIIIVYKEDKKTEFFEVELFEII